SSHWPSVSGETPLRAGAGQRCRVATPAAASSFPRGSAGTLKRVEPRKKHRRPKPRPGARAAGKPAGALRTDWGDVAEWYDELVGEEGSEYHRKVVFPGVLRLLGDVKGRRVLDVA